MLTAEVSYSGVRPPDPETEFPGDPETVRELPVMATPGIFNGTLFVVSWQMSLLLFDKTLELGKLQKCGGCGAYFGMSNAKGWVDIHPKTREPRFHKRKPAGFKCRWCGDQIGW